MWCEAGGDVAGFMAATPRTAFLAIRGYLRRRGWLAWHFAALPRIEPLPDLARLSGMATRRQTNDQALASVRAWKAALAARDRG